ncbi:MAG TPA: protease complex subunit PrcB family protein [Arenibaculum sp.]|nr:protease complex subunit PrcB family protein [Arenibaculum sp.]
MVLRPAVLILSAALLAGCEWSASLLTGEPPAWGSGTAMAEQTLGVDGEFDWQGQQAEAQGRAFGIARTGDEWQALWSRTGTQAPGPLPRGWMAVAVFAGTRPTGGYSVEIVSMDAAAQTGAPDRLRVSYRIQAPPGDAMVTQALTSPWAIRVFPALQGEVQFMELD